MLRHLRVLARGATLPLGAVLLPLNEPAAAQPNIDAVMQGADGALRQAKDYNAFMAAEEIKSPLCKGYVGKTVTPVAPDALAQRLGGAGRKGEFETTAQYQARHSTAASVGTVVLATPIVSEHVHYDADTGGMTVTSGAFGPDSFSDATGANMAAEIGLFAELGEAGRRHNLRLFSSERQTGSSLARNVAGVTVRITDVERHTRGLSVDAGRLFPFATDDGSTVAMFDISPTAAARLKPALRAAIVAQPVAPFVVRHSMRGPAATLRNPVQYTELSTIIVAEARCGLVLDGQGKVLASADAGAAK